MSKICEAADLVLDVTNCDTDETTLELYRDTDGTTDVTLYYWNAEGEREKLELPVGRRIV